MILNTHFSAAIPGKVLRYDYRSAVRDGIRRLQELGHREIYYLTMFREPWDQRFQEFVSAFSEDRIWNLDKRRASPEDWKAFLDRHPGCSAMFHLNDFLAMDTIRNCSALGLDVPGDLSVVGFDNIRATEYSLPSLSTVSRPLSEAASHAVTALLAQLKGKKSELPEILPCRFIQRESIR